MKKIKHQIHIMGCIKPGMKSNGIWEKVTKNKIWVCRIKPKKGKSALSIQRWRERSRFKIENWSLLSTFWSSAKSAGFES